MLHFIHRNQIDEQQWNETIRLSAKPFPYALTGYMDAVSQNWEGLLAEDYSIVVPLPFVNTLGMRRLLQPYFCQQLGVFAKTVVSPGQHQDIVNQLAHRYLTANYKMNAAIDDGHQLQHVANQVLLLDKSYDELHYCFQSSVARNIRHAAKDGVVVKKSVLLDAHIGFYVSAMRNIGQVMHHSHEARFRKLCAWFQQENMLEVYEAQSSASELLAVQLLLRYSNRLILLANASSSSGRKHNAISAIFNAIIAAYAESNLLLDFEGSEVASIAQFNHSFGATDEIYYRWQKTIFGRV